MKSDTDSRPTHNSALPVRQMSKSHTKDTATNERQQNITVRLLQIIPDLTNSVGAQHLLNVPPNVTINSFTSTTNCNTKIETGYQMLYTAKGNGNVPMTVTMVQQASTNNGQCQ